MTKTTREWVKIRGWRQKDSWLDKIDLIKSTDLEEQLLSMLQKTSSLRMMTDWCKEVSTEP